MSDLEKALFHALSQAANMIAVMQVVGCPKGAIDIPHFIADPIALYEHRSQLKTGGDD